MRAPMKLRYLAHAKQQAKRIGEMESVIGRYTQRDTAGFSATSGMSLVENAGTPWMPHHYRPTVGFTPNPPRGSAV